MATVEDISPPHTSLFGAGFKAHQDNTSYNIRKILLKAYLKKINNENDNNDEINQLIKQMINIENIDDLSDDNIKSVVHIVLKTQSFLNDGSQIEQLFTTMSVACDKIGNILSRNYPKSNDVISTVVYQLKSTISNMRKLKNQNVEKLVMIASMDDNNSWNNKNISMRSILIKSLITALISISVFTIVNIFDNKSSNNNNPIQSYLIENEDDADDDDYLLPLSKRMKVETDFDQPSPPTSPVEH